MKLNYNDAYDRLAELVEEIEDPKIQLDKLAEKIKEAKELIEFCEKSLRKLDGEVKVALGEE